MRLSRHRLRQRSYLPRRSNRLGRSLRGTPEGDIMKTLFLTLIVASCGGWLGPWAVPAYADTLSGQVQASDGTPIAGLTMYLAHPTVGRSSAILTDSSGRFRFLNVP